MSEVLLYMHVQREGERWGREGERERESGRGYRDTSLERKRTSLGPYRRPTPMFPGGGAFSYGRGTPVQDLLRTKGTRRP